MSIIEKLNKNGLLAGAPECVLRPEYEVIGGSTSYGVTSNSSDIDIVSICLPDKNELFPHLTGKVAGFYPSPAPFENWQRHHIQWQPGTAQAKEYDVASYSIVPFFKLAAENNPNIIDSLFVPDRCVSHQTDIGRLLRQNRQKFLSLACFPKFRGYALSQMKRIKTFKPVGKRAELVDNFGYDVKFAYHTIRLADEVKQILLKGDLNLEENREELKDIRAGSWSFEKFDSEFERRLVQLDDLYLTSKLRREPDWNELNKLLLVCLEIRYGSLSAMVDNSSEAQAKLDRISQILKE